eukprot:6193198-Pleurochrysis_carterae.AAC.2
MTPQQAATGSAHRRRQRRRVAAWPARGHRCRPASLRAARPACRLTRVNTHKRVRKHTHTQTQTHTHRHMCARARLHEGSRVYKHAARGHPKMSGRWTTHTRARRSSLAQSNERVHARTLRCSNRIMLMDTCACCSKRSRMQTWEL